MSKLKRILLMAGGTGGHVYPALALAKSFRAQNIDVHWLGTKEGIEARLVPQAEIPLHLITIKGIRGKGLKGLLSAPWLLMKAILQAFHVIRSVKPDIVIGLGGFVSGPGGIASFFMRKKLYIHEQNAKPGLTNQWLAKIAYRVFEGFPNTFKKRKNVVTTGNPVREEILLLPAPTLRMKERSLPARLLIFGGSLGAKSFNQLLPSVLSRLPLDIRPEIRHQTGEKDFTQTKASYARYGVVADVVPFIHEMDKAYGWADMVLCRAGALTVTELCTVGLGAILIPYPYAVDDHQTANAQFMVNNKAAILIPEAKLSETQLSKILQDLCASMHQRLIMANAAYELRCKDAAERIVTICKEINH